MQGGLDGRVGMSRNRDLEHATQMVLHRLRNTTASWLPLATRRVSLRLAALPALTGYGLMVDPSTGAGGLPCLWKLAFGVACPGCGLSRASALLVRGRLTEAIAMNWLIVPVVAVAVFVFASEFVNPHRRTSWQS
jgi:Protein of unknown function (DUF2752)